MRKSRFVVYYLSVLLVIIMVLSGCSQAVPEYADRIMSPTILDVSFAGTWMLESSVSGDLSAVVDENAPMEGVTVGFNEDTLLFEGTIYSHIRYKVKRVNVYEYFLHKKAGLPEKLDYETGEITVTTVYSKENFLFEFIEDKNGTKIAVIDDNYYNMRKISDVFNADIKTAVNENERNELDDSRSKNHLLRSGLLLGVRIPVKTADGHGDYKYGTYWISCTDRSARQVLYADDIYLPRMDGFWKLIVEKKPGLRGLEDTLNAYKVSNEKGMASIGLYENVSSRIETKSRKAIVYVGNDYVCVENTVYGGQDDNEAAGANEMADSIAASSDNAAALPDIMVTEEKTLRTLPVDNLSNVDGIKISDMAGENGTMAMENAISDVLKDSGYEGAVLFDDESQERNFALYRKTGHWFFKGRIDPDGQGQLPFMDFNLNLLPPSNMVAYDVLYVPWTEMKDKLPNAIDIYTSPNKDMAVVLTRNEILLYAIENRKLSEQPMAKLEMEEGSTVVMAEWGMGEYVTSWEKSFIKNNITRAVETIKDSEAIKAGS